MPELPLQILLIPGAEQLQASPRGWENGPSTLPPDGQLEDAGLAEIHKLYRCHDRLLIYKQAVFDRLAARWRDLFNVSYDVLLMI
jgi:hypothetical protein